MLAFRVALAVALLSGSMAEVRAADDMATASSGGAAITAGSVQPRACQASGMCSLGKTKPFIGEIDDLAALKAALAARSFNNEVILLAETRPVAAASAYQEFRLLGLDNVVVLGGGKPTCSMLSALFPGVGCVWSSATWPRKEDKHYMVRAASPRLYLLRHVLCRRSRSPAPALSANLAVCHARTHARVRRDCAVVQCSVPAYQLTHHTRPLVPPSGLSSRRATGSRRLCRAHRAAGIQRATRRQRHHDVPRPLPVPEGPRAPGQDELHGHARRQWNGQLRRGAWVLIPMVPAVAQRPPGGGRQGGGRAGAGRAASALLGAGEEGSSQGAAESIRN